MCAISVRCKKKGIAFVLQQTNALQNTKKILSVKLMFSFFFGGGAFYITEGGKYHCANATSFSALKYPESVKKIDPSFFLGNFGSCLYCDK